MTTILIQTVGWPFQFRELSTYSIGHALVYRNGYEKPTPIQAQAIPTIMSGRDMIGKNLFFFMKVFINMNYFAGFLLFYGKKDQIHCKNVWLKRSKILCPNICTKPVPRMNAIAIRFQ